ncbi:MAG: hypothetical protein DMG64_03930 [Acidobacteria bacterium]|nr:MAG: hypothetical protein DMG64_03930 [Acidobacteriota bacterium]PYY21290.1 MAG: hypothetical protein DMG62_20000 [Acidobacteriota bacterium]
MKNALILVLLVVVTVLGVLLYKCKSLSKLQVTHHQRKDHSGNSLETVDCPVRTGQDKKTCIIPVSYLTSMVNGWDEDYAIEVHHKDTIKWIGDNGESIDVPEMLGVRCSDHTKRDTPADGDLSLISQISPSGNIVTAQVTANKKNENYCYKNTIRVTVNGKTTPIDPHEFLEQ